MSTELSELFDRDPLHLSEQAIDAIVQYQREHQTQHELGVKTAPAPKAKRPSKTQDLLKELGLASSGDLLKDLGLK